VNEPTTVTTQEGKNIFLIRTTMTIYEESLMGSIGTFSVELCGCGCGRKAKVSQENKN